MIQINSVNNSLKQIRNIREGKVLGTLQAPNGKKYEVRAVFEQKGQLYTYQDGMMIPEETAKKIVEFAKLSIAADATFTNNPPQEKIMTIFPDISKSVLDSYVKSSEDSDFRTKTFEPILRSTINETIQGQEVWREIDALMKGPLEDIFNLTDEEEEEALELKKSPSQSKKEMEDLMNAEERSKLFNGNRAFKDCEQKISDPDYKSYYSAAAKEQKEDFDRLMQEIKTWEHIAFNSPDGLTEEELQLKRTFETQNPNALQKERIEKFMEIFIKNHGIIQKRIEDAKKPQDSLFEKEIPILRPHALSEQEIQDILNSDPEYQIMAGNLNMDEYEAFRNKAEPEIKEKYDALLKEIIMWYNLASKPEKNWTTEEKKLLGSHDLFEFISQEERVRKYMEVFKKNYKTIQEMIKIWKSFESMPETIL
ncbi:MAG: hypothetical protein Tsb0015_14380 [Simkaniaceae bacterium]